LFNATFSNQNSKLEMKCRSMNVSRTTMGVVVCGFAHMDVNLTSFDHYAIHILLEKNRPHLDGPPVQLGICYEAAWRQAEDYSAVVEDGWAGNSVGPNPLHLAWSSLNQLAGKLKDWSKVSFGSVRREINKMERALSNLRRSAVSHSNLAEEKRVECQLCELFEREEIMARQQSWVE
jgi:hypothetical protein